MPGGRYRNARDGEPLKISGLPVPFTFWPDAFVRHGRLVASNPWTCMMGHVNRMVNNTKQRRRAIAFLEQSEGFYRAASGPGIASKPLLYYYSYLNLAKAFLTACHNLPLEHCMHGLKEPDDNIRKRLTITSQEVKVNDSGGGRRTQVYREFVKECGFTVPPRPRPIKLVDLLEQVVGIHRTVSHTLNRKQRFFPIDHIGFEHNRSRREVWVALRIRRTNLGSSNDTPNEIRNGMAAFEEVTSPDGEYRRYESRAVNTYGRSPKETLKPLVKKVKKDIWSLLGPGGYRFFIGSIPPDKRLAQVASNYQAMFYFGSITRYRPDDFLKLVDGKHGWLVQEFINTQPLQFIYLLGSGLLKTEMVVPEAATGLI